MMQALRAQPAAALWMALLLAACTTPAPPPLRQEPTPETVANEVQPVVDEQRLAFERRQRARADDAQARGHWDEVALAWELLSLLRPDDVAARERAASARERARRDAAGLAALAQAAYRRGDPDGAAQRWLEALALDPGLREAADALRRIELERERRRLAGRNLRLGSAATTAPARRPTDDGTMGSANADGAADRRIATAREHATLLARQGDLDAAIQILREVVTVRSEAPARSQLADLHVQKAGSLRQKDPQAALASVEAALALDRRHGAALALQRQLTQGRSGTGAPLKR